MLLVDAFELIQEDSLLAATAFLIFQEFKTCILRGCVRISWRTQRDTLMHIRKKGTAKIIHAAVQACRADGNETGQVLILGAKSVTDPGSHAGSNERFRTCK